MPELALIERIAERTAVRPGTTLGIGDDAALLDLGRTAVATHDMLVEGVHFRRATTSLRDLGAKALVVNLSDLAAMGAEPVAALVGLGLPAGMGDDEVGGIYAGIEEVAAEHGLTVAGGDITSAPVLILGVTALGRARPGVPPVLRSGGRPGDALCVTGPLGGAAAGLLLLEDSGPTPDLPRDAALIAAHRRPAARVTEGWALAAGGATAMLDLSDGLGLDARRLARASGARARVRLADLPLAPGVERVAARAGRDARLLAATGGEDYELLAAVPPGRVDALRVALGGRLHVVGELVEGEPGVDLIDGDGAAVHPARLGWEHGDG